MNDTTPGIDPARLERLLARDEIRDVLSRYARGVDRADGPLLKSCYHPDAIEEHGGNYTGNAFEYVDGAIPRIRAMGVMQHLLGTSHIEFDGDTAWVETYIWTFARFAQGRPRHRHLHRRPPDRPLRAPRRRLEDRAPAHRVRLEPRHAHRAKAGAPACSTRRSRACCWPQGRRRPVLRSPLSRTTMPTPHPVQADLLPVGADARRAARRRRLRRHAGRRARPLRLQRSGGARDLGAAPARTIPISRNASAAAGRGAPSAMRHAPRRRRRRAVAAGPAHRQPGRSVLILSRQLDRARDPEVRRDGGARARAAPSA